MHLLYLLSLPVFSIPDFDACHGLKKPLSARLFQGRVPTIFEKASQGI